MVQNYNNQPGVIKLDGYNVKHIQEITGSACKFCKKSHGISTCFVPKCRAFYHLPCGISNGSIQLKRSKRSFCPKHHKNALKQKSLEDRCSTIPIPVKRKNVRKSDKKVKNSEGNGESRNNTPANSQEFYGSQFSGIYSVEGDEEDLKLENIEVLWVKNLPDPDPVVMDDEIQGGDLKISSYFKDT